MHAPTPRTAPPRLGGKSKGITGFEIKKSLPLIERQPTLAIPRRYEDTKPAVVQEFTHRRIIEFGQLIHKQTLERALHDRGEAVAAACRTVALEAEAKQQVAIDAALKVVQLEHEKEIKRLHRKYRQERKEEISRLEAWMVAAADERVMNEQLAGEKRLNLAVKQTRDGWAADKQDAVQNAEQTERDIASKHYQEIKNEAAEILDQVREAAARDKKEAVEAMRVRKERERQEAVRTAVDAGEAKVTKVLMKLEEEKVVAERRLRQAVDRGKAVAEQLKKEIEKGMDRRKALFAEMQLLREDYKSFVDRHSVFHDPGQSEYMVPQFYTGSFDEP